MKRSVRILTVSAVLILLILPLSAAASATGGSVVPASVMLAGPGIEWGSLLLRLLVLVVLAVPGLIVGLRRNRALKSSGAPASRVPAAKPMMNTQQTVQAPAIRAKAPVQNKQALHTPQDTDIASAQVQKPTGWMLCCESGVMRGRTWPLPEGILSIGTGQSNQVCCPQQAEKVSPVHCCVIRQGDEVTLLDMNSDAGTFVLNSGKMMPNTSRRIYPGDRFFLGEEDNLFTLVRE